MGNFKNLKAEQKLLIAAVAAGATAMVLAYLMLTSLERSTREKMLPVRVVAAAKYIPAWAEITEDMVEYKDIPKDMLTSAHIVDFAKLKGEKTLVPFVAGEPILINKVASRGESLNTAIPTGLRAVSVAVDEVSGVSNMIRQSDFVDVLLLFEVNENKKVYTVSTTILQAVQILATGTSFAGTQEAGYSTVTLALTPEEAELIAFAKEKGRLSLALRPIGDRAKVKVKLASFNELIKQIKQIEKGEDEEIKDAVKEKQQTGADERGRNVLPADEEIMKR